MIIGLTGGIGSGKSTVLSLFKEAGFEIFIADVEAKKLLNSNTELIQQVKNLFGEKAYSNGALNRKYIAAIVFNNKDKLEQLNALVHPKVKEVFFAFTNQVKVEFIIYEAAILFESGSAEFCEFIITVTADFETKINRIFERDKISKTEILARMKNQLEDDYRIKKSHFIINNNGTLTQTKQQVKTVISILKSFNNSFKSS